MFVTVRSRLTYANVMATLAVFIALGGSSYAAITVTGKNVKDGSLTGRDVRDGSLATGDVRDRSLLTQDFKAGQLPAGPRGPEGPAGQQGPAGPQGSPGSDAQFAGAAAGGDLTGTFPAPSIAAGAITGGVGGKVGDDTLTGADIDESSLSDINATRLEGRRAADFLGSSAVAGGDLTGTFPNPSIAPNAVSGGEVAPDTLTGADISEPSLDKVPNADQLDGLNGRDFLRSQLLVGTAESFPLGIGGGHQVEVRCPGNGVAISAGWDPHVMNAFVPDVSVPHPGGQLDRWIVGMTNQNSPTPRSFTAYVLCASRFYPQD